MDLPSPVPVPQWLDLYADADARPIAVEGTTLEHLATFVSRILRKLKSWSAEIDGMRLASPSLGTHGPGTLLWVVKAKLEVHPLEVDWHDPRLHSFVSWNGKTKDPVYYPYPTLALVQIAPMGPTKFQVCIEPTRIIERFPSVRALCDCLYDEIGKAFNTSSMPSRQPIDARPQVENTRAEEQQPEHRSKEQLHSQLLVERSDERLSQSIDTPTSREINPAPNPLQMATTPYLNETEQRVLDLWRNYVAANNRVPKYSEIAAEYDISERYYRKNLSKLRKLGLIPHTQKSRKAISS